MDLAVLETIGWSPNSLTAFLSDSKTPVKEHQIFEKNLSLKTPPSHNLSSRIKRSLGTPISLSNSVSRVSKMMGTRLSPTYVDETSTSPANSHRSNLENNQFASVSTVLFGANACYPLNEIVEKSTATEPKRDTFPSKSLLTAKELLREKENISSQAPVKDKKGIISSSISNVLDAAALDEPLPNGWTLYRHQQEAISACIRLGRTILAFDMGLGKTMIGLIWAKAISSVVSDCVTVIISPCTLTEVWRREAEMLGFTTLLPCKSKVTVFSTPKIIFLTWSKLYEPAELGKLYGLSTFKFLILADEAHAMQSLTSQRTQAALKLCLHAQCIGAVLATGTPMKNGRPSNILPLLIAIRHPIARNKLEFEKRYCNAKKTRFCAWDTSGASNLEELRKNIGPHLLRKTKEECLDLPIMQRRFVKVPVSVEDEKEYQDIVAQMQATRGDALRKALVRGATGRGEGGAGGGQNLELASRLRMLSSMAKVCGTAVYLRDMLARCRDPIVVFVCFKETARSLVCELTAISDISSPLSCQHFTGDILKHSDRQCIVDSFQAGEIDVLVCTFGVASTGLTLTRSHTVVLLDRPWTPGDVKQAEDRVRRIGQRSTSVESVWITAFDCDEKVDTLLQSKDTSTQKVLKDGQYRKFHQSTSNLAAKEGNRHRSDSAKSNEGGGQKKGAAGGYAPAPDTAKQVCLDRKGSLPRTQDLRAFFGASSTSSVQRSAHTPASCVRVGTETAQDADCSFDVVTHFEGAPSDCWNVGRDEDDDAATEAAIASMLGFDSFTIR